MTHDHIPDEFQGKLEPNAYCRAWIPAEERYCDRPAGKETYHPGEGRCASHDGRPPSTAKHVTHSRLPTTVRDIYEDLALAGSAYDMEHDINMAEASILARLREHQADLDEWEDSGREGPAPRFPTQYVVDAHETLSRMRKRAHDVRNHESNVFPRDAVKKILYSIVLAVERWVTTKGMTDEERLGNLGNEIDELTNKHLGVIIRFDG